MVQRDVFVPRLARRAAELLGISCLELKDWFLRLRIPLRQGPASLAEARVECAKALGPAEREFLT